jgi:hypothetical protein
MPSGSIPRPPLHVEDGASMAFRADEPLTPARVPESERPAANGPGGEADPTPRATRGLAGRHRLPDLALLVGGELRLFGRHAPATDTTTFPNCWPVCSRSKAYRPSSSGTTLSIGGRRRPDRSSSTMAANSLSLPIVEPMIVH